MVEKHGKLFYVQVKVIVKISKKMLCSSFSIDLWVIFLAKGVG
jgi:hypothetical protein